MVYVGGSCCFCLLDIIFFYGFLILVGWGIREGMVVCFGFCVVFIKIIGVWFFCRLNCYLWFFMVMSWCLILFLNLIMEGNFYMVKNLYVCNKIWFIRLRVILVVNVIVSCGY